MRWHSFFQSACKIGFASFLTLVLFSFASPVQAEAIRIVALGASNTAGKGVDSSQAWPARLEGLLKAKGYDVSMTVDAVSGDTSAGIASRAASIPAGTQVVLYDAGTNNDQKAGVSDASRQGNVGDIVSRIRARGATPIRVIYQGLPRQPDGIHLTAAGHAALAARLLPQVTAALGKRH